LVIGALRSALTASEDSATASADSWIAAAAEIQTAAESLTESVIATSALIASEFEAEAQQAALVWVEAQSGAVSAIQYLWEAAAVKIQGSVDSISAAIDASNERIVASTAAAADASAIVWEQGTAKISLAGVFAPLEEGSFKAAQTVGMAWKQVAPAIEASMAEAGQVGAAAIAAPMNAALDQVAAKGTETATKLDAGFAGVRASISGLFTGAIALGGLDIAIKGATEYSHEILQIAAAFNVTAQQAALVRTEAGIVGQTVQSLVPVISRLTRGAGDAGSAIGQALARYGIDAEKFRDSGVQEQLKILADGYQRAGDNRKKFLADILGGRGTQIAPLIANFSQIHFPKPSEEDIIGIAKFQYQMEALVRTAELKILPAITRLQGPLLAFLGIWAAFKVKDLLVGIFNKAAGAIDTVIARVTKMVAASRAGVAGNEALGTSATAAAEANVRLAASETAVGNAALAATAEVEGLTAANLAAAGSSGAAIAGRAAGVAEAGSFGALSNQTLAGTEAGSFAALSKQSIAAKAAIADSSAALNETMGATLLTGSKLLPILGATVIGFLDIKDAIAGASASFKDLNLTEAFQKKLEDVSFNQRSTLTKLKDNVLGFLSGKGPNRKQYNDAASAFQQFMDDAIAKGATQSRAKEIAIAVVNRAAASGLSLANPAIQKFARYMDQVDTLAKQAALDTANLSGEQEKARGVLNSYNTVLGQHMDLTQKSSDLIKSAADSYVQFRDSASSSLNFVISDLQTLEGQSNLTAEGLAKHLDLQLKESQTFADNLKTIAADGTVGAKELAKQFLAAGPAAYHAAYVTAHASSELRTHIESDVSSSYKLAGDSAASLTKQLLGGFREIAAAILVATGEAKTFGAALKTVSTMQFPGVNTAPPASHLPSNSYAANPWSTSPNVIPGWGRRLLEGGLFSWPTQHRESGGPIEPNVPYVVGERGPELFVTSERGGIVPQTQGRGSGSDRVEIVITNWESGKGYIRYLARDEGAQKETYQGQLARMGR
jgi:hypothetical protein